MQGGHGVYRATERAHHPHGLETALWRLLWGRGAEGVGGRATGSENEKEMMGRSRMGASDSKRSPHWRRGRSLAVPCIKPRGVAGPSRVAAELIFRRSRIKRRENPSVKWITDW